MSVTDKDVAAWKRDAVTKEFFSYIELTIEDNTNTLHAAFGVKGIGNEELLRQLIACNAVLVQLEEVKDIPERMIEVAKNKEAG